MRRSTSWRELQRQAEEDESVELAEAFAAAADAARGFERSVEAIADSLRSVAASIEDLLRFAEAEDDAMDIVLDGICPANFPYSPGKLASNIQAHVLWIMGSGRLSELTMEAVEA